MPEFADLHERKDEISFKDLDIDSIVIEDEEKEEE